MREMQHKKDGTLLLYILDIIYAQFSTINLAKETWKIPINARYNKSVM